MVSLISRFLKEYLSPGTSLKIYFVILIISICVGFCAAHFFKGNKKAKVIETYAEKIIERETGISINFEEAGDDTPEQSEMRLSEPMSMPFTSIP